MKDKLKVILEKLHRYNSKDVARLAFGLDKDEEYDLLVVAPSFTPSKLGMDEYSKVTLLKEGSYIKGYLVLKDDLKIAWIVTSASDCNLIDHMIICADLKFKSCVFIGAVGALKKEFNLGDICTPEFSINGAYANTYLKDSIRDYVPFEKVCPNLDYVNSIIHLGKENGVEIKKASVYCTPSIALEYYHLDEIKEFDTDLIEMETASFYLMMDLIEKPGIALLVVSDNSANGIPLVGRNEEEQIRYMNSKNTYIPRMILKIAEEAKNGF